LVTFQFKVYYWEQYFCFQMTNLKDLLAVQRSSIRKNNMADILVFLLVSVYFCQYLRCKMFQIYVNKKYVHCTPKTRFRTYLPLQ